MMMTMRMMIAIKGRNMLVMIKVVFIRHQEQYRQREHRNNRSHTYGIVVTIQPVTASDNLTKPKVKVQ